MDYFFEILKKFCCLTVVAHTCHALCICVPLKELMPLKYHNENPTTYSNSCLILSRHFTSLGMLETVLLAIWLISPVVIQVINGSFCIKKPKQMNETVTSPKSNVPSHDVTQNCETTQLISVHTHTTQKGDVSKVTHILRRNDKSSSCMEPCNPVVQNTSMDGNIRNSKRVSLG